MEILQIHAEHPQLCTSASAKSIMPFTCIMQRQVYAA